MTLSFLRGDIKGYTVTGSTTTVDPLSSVLATGAQGVISIEVIVGNAQLFFGSAANDDVVAFVDALGINLGGGNAVRFPFLIPLVSDGKELKLNTSGATLTILYY